MLNFSIKPTDTTLTHAFQPIRCLKRAVYNEPVSTWGGTMVIQLMLQSLHIKFSENQGVWACAVVNEKEKYFLEKAA